MALVDRSAADKPRVLIATSSLDIGGTERHLAQVTTALRARGWPITIYCFTSLGAQAEAVAGAGVEVVAPPVDTSLARLSPMRRIYCTARATARLSRLITSHKPSIIHFFLAEAYLAGAPLALMQSVPVRLMSRRSLNRYQAHWPGSARLERWLQLRMTAVLANSRAIVSELREEGCDPARIGLIYNGVDLEALGRARARQATRAALGIGEDVVVAVMIANLHPYKGYADLIAGLGLVRDRMPKDWLMLCVGRDQGTEASLMAEAWRVGISSNIRFLGTRSDVPDLLAAADFGVLCSHEEGFSNAVIESMAAGLAMVVTDVGGNPEAVIDGVTGDVVPPHDAAALGKAIARLAGDSARRNRFGRAGRARAESSFAMPECVARYESVYLGLLAGRPISDIAGLSPPDRDGFPAMANEKG